MRFGNLRLKWKLATLLLLMLLAMAVLGGVGYLGISRVGASVTEIGAVRLPSIYGLLVLSEGQTAVDKASLSTAIYENDYRAQAHFAQVLRERSAAWANVKAGWEKYEPLPQTAEEAQLWRQFVQEWNDWKQSDALLEGIIGDLAANQSEAQQKALFGQFFRHYANSQALFSSAKGTLNKITELNDRIASAAVTSGQQATASASWAMEATMLISVLVAVIGLWYVALAITRPIGTAIAVAGAVATGDLTSAVEVSTTDETGQLLRSLNIMNCSLAAVVSKVRQGADNIADASGNIAEGSTELSERTEQQAASLEETASSMEQLTATMRHNLAKTEQANKMAQESLESAAQAGDAVLRVVRTMADIQAASAQITDITGVIDSIAFQTNILALNAAVEAARAGDTGRGFAVVAAEVRGLAQRSAAAAREIQKLIGESGQRVAEGAQLVGETGITMEQVVASVRSVTGIIADISVATHEQSAGIEQINRAIGLMDGVTQENAALVEQAAGSAAALREQAASLMVAVDAFRINAVDPKRSTPMIAALAG